MSRPELPDGPVASIAARPIGARSSATTPIPTALAALALLLVGLAATACGATESTGPELVAVPRPELSSLPEAGRQAIETQRAELDALLGAAETPAPALAEAFGETGRYYQAHELLLAAEPCYRNAEALDPTRVDWPYLLGHVYRAGGRRAEAVEAFERALAIDPGLVPARVWQAEIRLEMEDLDAAEAAARAALEADPKAAPALILLGRIASERGEPAEAVRLLEQALALAPEASEIHYPLGLAYRALGDEDRAAGLLSRQGGVKARLDDPLLEGLDDLVVSAGAALNRGTRALGQGRAEDAEREFRAAIALEPENIRGYTNLAVVLAGKGDGPAAIAALEQALAIEPDNARANFNLASLLARYGRPDEAAERFEAALASDPSYGEAHFNYANALVRLDRLDEAAEHYGRVITLDPGNRDAHLMQGVLLARLARWDAAVEALEAAHASLPDDPVISNSLARVLAVSAGQPGADPARAERALTLADGLVAGQRDLSHGEAQAMALAAAGRFDEAARIQSDLVGAARSAGFPDLVASLEINLARYRAGQPAEAPWTPDDPNLPGLQ